MPERIPPEVIALRRDVARLERRRDILLREAARHGSVDHTQLSEIDRSIAAARDGVMGAIDPCDAGAEEPLVLLPVRLETRFSAAGGSTTLRVRIYPDEIHVDDLARGLTPRETEAGQAYWTSVWAEPPLQSAWAALVAAVGPDRAEWVAYATTPTNLAARGTAGTPDFGTIEARGPRNVVARALPDRFVVIAIQGDRVSKAIGKAVPSDLSLTPIPLAGDAPTRVADALTVPPGSEWLVDYDRAVEVGMAVTVTLQGGQAPVDRVIAIGTRNSLSPAAAADEFEDLLVGHRFSDGLGLLPQGTPTNNSDADRSPYRARKAPVAPSLTPPTAMFGSDAAATAGVLGIGAEALTSLVGHGTGEQSTARNVNTALWAPGLGEFLSRMDEQGVPGVVDAQRESARLLYRDHVRGGGPASTIRVGAQPYGVLPVTNLDAWVPQTGEITEGIAKVVRKLTGRWLAAAAHKVPVIRPGDPNIDATTLDVLGSSPVMQGLRVRPVVSDDVSGSVLAALGIDHREYEAEKISTAAVFSDLLQGDARKIVIGSLHGDTRPLPLQLVSARDAEFITALLGTPSRVLPIDSVLQALLALAWQSSELDVAKAAPASVLPHLVGFIELEPRLKADAAGLVARAEAATAEELHGAVSRLQAAGVTIGGPSALRAFQPIEQVQTSLAEVALSAPATAEAKMLGAAALAGWLAAMGNRNEVREAMQALVTSDLETRRLAVAHALDCSSHRLDAWVTAIVSERRDRQLARAPETRGLTIGAYGVVENLRPAAGAGRDGWIYAPSTRHAVAAGMLRSSHLSHLPAAGTDGGPFAIDLSSRRVQRAVRVIEGVRQGQALGALIGYQIERGLAQAKLARLQLSLRTIAPLVARRLHDDDGADSPAAQEAIAAANVVDGTLLLQRHPPGDPALKAKLDVAPENAYLEPGDWQPLTAGEWESVTMIMRDAADAIDAVADVMLSESILQFANGNPQRAAAAMDAMSTGASPSDSIDMLETPEGGERLTHRILAVVGANAPASSGWNASRPRAMAEPRLEAWAAQYLGDPGDIVVAAPARRITLAEAGFAALDLVFATDPAALERTLRVSIPDLGDTPLAATRDPSWPGKLRALGQVVGLASTLRSLIAGAQPLLPDALARPGDQPDRDLAAALPELTGRVTALAGSLAAAVAALQSTVSMIPDSGVVDDHDVASGVSHAALALEPFGILLQPTPALPLDVSWVRSAWHAAEARFLAAQSAAQRLAALPADTPPRLVVEAAQEVAGTVFGDGFLVVPLLASAAGHDAFVASMDSPAFAAPASSEIRRLVRDVGTVRTQVGRLSEALLVSSALGRRRSLDVVQLSERDANGVPAPGTTHWLAGALPAEGPWPGSPVAHLIVDRVGSVDGSAPVAGLVLDAWVEDLPAQVGPKADPDDPRPGRVRTGLAIRADSASARAPQLVLSAISPDGKRWTTDTIRALVERTLDLARIRMVTLERLSGEGLILPALYTRSASLQGEQQLFFQNLAALAAIDVQMPFVKESGP